MIYSRTAISGPVSAGISLGRGEVGPQDEARGLLTGLVVLGIGLRVLSYLVDSPIWQDEAYLSINLLDRGYGDMLRPLDQGQVAPLGYLWAVLTPTKLFGFSTWSSRFVAVAAAVIAMVLFRIIAGRLLSGSALLLAVGVFAVSHYPVRYAGMNKPYSMDLLVALMLLWPATAWLMRSRNPDGAHRADRPLWVLVLAAVPAVLLSYPSIFVAGGVALALLPAAWVSRRRSSVVAAIIFGALSVAAFIAHYALLGQGQYQDGVTQQRTMAYWDEAFPDLTDPIGLLGWFFGSHTGRMFAYPIGADRGGSVLTTVCFAFGIAALWRSKHRSLLAMLLAPFALLAIAAVMKRYPYGGSGRVTQFLAPSICLLSGLGAAALIARGRDLITQERVLRGVVISLIVFGVGLGTYRIVRPHRKPHDVASREVARWLWQEQAHNSVLVCAWGDLKTEALRTSITTTEGAKFLCNQRAMFVRLRQRAPVPWDMVSPSRPLRVVVYWHTKRGPLPDIAVWANRLPLPYIVRRVDRYSFASYKREGGDEIYVYEMTRAGIPQPLSVN